MWVFLYSYNKCSNTRKTLAKKLLFVATCVGPSFPTNMVEKSVGCVHASYRAGCSGCVCTVEIKTKDVNRRGHVVRKPAVQS